MKLKEILSRITGFSTPIFGLSWQPPHRERVVAERVLTFLEDRRVLFPQYLNYNLLSAKSGYPIKSVIEVRQYITKEMQAVPRDSNLYNLLKRIRIACGQFLEELEIMGIDELTQTEHPLVTLKSKMPALITNLCFAYGIELSLDLNKMFPSELRVLFPVEETIKVEDSSLELTGKLKILHKRNFKTKTS